MCSLPRLLRRALLASVGMVTLLAMFRGTTWGTDFAWAPSPLSADWDDPYNWVGPPAEFPNSSDDTALVNGIPTTGYDPTLTAHRLIGALTISNNGDVNTGDGAGNNYRLIARKGTHPGTILIEDPGSSLTIYSSEFFSDVTAEAMTINSGGDVYLRGGGATLEIKALDINVGGEVSGAGTIWINSVNQIVNDGEIRAEPVGGSSTLTILPTLAGVNLDMDGAGGNGAMTATAGTALYVRTQINDPFDGTLTIGRDAEFFMQYAWTLSAVSNGVIDFNGGTGTATLSGGSLTSDSTINVNSGTAVFEDRLFANVNSTLNIAAGATVDFGTQAELRNPDNIFNGDASTWIIRGDVDIGEGSGEFDWDGDITGTGTTIVQTGGRLNIDVDRVDKGLYEVYQGTIEMYSGDIDVQNLDGQWEMAGELKMRNYVDQSPVLSGAEILITGDLSVRGSGGSRIAAPTIFDSTSSVVVGPGAVLELGGSAATCVIAGGTWTGSGTIDLNADRTIIFAATTVDMPDGVFDLDGELRGLLSIEAPLTLNVRQVEHDVNEGIDDDVEIGPSGQLNVQFTNPAESYRLDATLDLNAMGGALNSLQLVGGAVEFAGTANVMGNSISDARVTLGGNTNIASGGSFSLRGGNLAAPDVILSSATFAGSGSLINAAGSAMTIEDGAVVDVELINLGHLNIGSSPGTAQVDSFVQTASGRYEAEVDGLIPVDEYDQLLVVNDAQIDGVLEIRVNENGGSYTDPAAPGNLDKFHLIITGDAVGGQFSGFVYDNELLTLSFVSGGMHRFHVGEGLFRILDYGTSTLDLLNYQALPGDANGDGYVDGGDFIIWNSNKFDDGKKWITGDFNGDGFTDGQDFIIWNAHKFTSVDLLSAVPEPSAETMVILAIVMFGFASRLGRRKTVRLLGGCLWEFLGKGANRCSC